MAIYVGRRANQRKIPKWLPFKKLQVRITKYLMCMYGGHLCICVPLTQCQGEVCTDNNDADANDAGR